MGGEAICEVCGVKYPIGGGAGDWHDETSHWKGKAHTGYTKIRATIVELKKKRRDWDKYRDKIEANKKRYREKERERERQEEKERRKIEREREKEKEIEKEREKERERERELARERSRSRDRKRQEPAAQESSSSDSDDEEGHLEVQQIGIAAFWAKIVTLEPRVRNAHVKALNNASRDRLEAWLVARRAAKA